MMPVGVQPSQRGRLLSTADGKRLLGRYPPGGVLVLGKGGERAGRWIARHQRDDQDRFTTLPPPADRSAARKGCVIKVRGEDDMTVSAIAHWMAHSQWRINAAGP